METAALLNALWTEAWRLHKGAPPMDGTVVEETKETRVVAVPVFVEPPRVKAPVGFRL